MNVLTVKVKKLFLTLGQISRNRIVESKGLHNFKAINNTAELPFRKIMSLPAIYGCPFL